MLFFIFGGQHQPKLWSSVTFQTLQAQLQSSEKGPILHNPWRGCGERTLLATNIKATFPDPNGGPVSMCSPVIFQLGGRESFCYSQISISFWFRQRKTCFRSVLSGAGAGFIQGRFPTSLEGHKDVATLGDTGLTKVSSFILQGPHRAGLAGNGTQGFPLAKPVSHNHDPQRELLVPSPCGFFQGRSPLCFVTVFPCAKN